MKGKNFPTMTKNNFVYPHPINTFIIKQLGLTVEQFCELHSIPQGTISSWITRNRKIDTLPISFLFALSLSASKSMDRIYSELLSLQEDYFLHLEKHRRVKSKIE